MRILMINVVCGVKSTGRICTDLAEAITGEGRGHIVKIGYGREEVPTAYQKYAVKIGTNKDVTFHALKARLFDAAGFGSGKATDNFIDFIRQYNPDVIHLHNVHGYYLHVGKLFKFLKTCGKKIIWTLHDSWAFTGHTPYCDTVSCEKWKTGCGKCPLKALYPKSKLDRSKANWKRKKALFTGIPNLTLVTPSEWLGNLVKASFLSEYEVKVIRNGIDTDVFKPTPSDIKEKLCISDKKMLLGVATAWDEMKGLSDFVRLSEILPEEYKLVLVGLTEAQKNALPENIVGMTRTADKEELAALYTAADCYLNLSHCENYPTTNLEARACGTRVLTYAVGGSPESAGRNAVIVDERTPEAVLSALAGISEDTAAPDTDGMNDSFTDSYLKLYLD